MPYVADEHEGRGERPGCVLCDLHTQVDDELALVLYRGRRAYIVMNLYPYNNGHVMAVPYDHVGSLQDLPPETQGEMMALITRAQGAIDSTMTPQGYNVGMNQGAAAGAGIVDHLHMHLVPRWVGDTNFMPALGDTRVIPQHIEETYAMLLRALSSAGDDG